jgi:hypothetical protein
MMNNNKNKNNMLLPPDNKDNMLLLPDNKDNMLLLPDNKDNGIIKSVSDNFEFPININDTVFTLALKKSIYRERLITVISKMVAINELKHINLDDMSEILNGMKIKQLNIFSIKGQVDSCNVVTTDKGSKVMYFDIDVQQFVKFSNYDEKFPTYNKNNLYILRGGNFIDVKNLFTTINNHCVNLGRGGSTKSHILSPLDLRLSSYLMAMFNFYYKLINNLNTFNYMSKDRYLS